jgi:peptidoglycan hydrolase CwlO-like protein
MEEISRDGYFTLMINSLKELSKLKGKQEKINVKKQHLDLDLQLLQQEIDNWTEKYEEYKQELAKFEEK